MDTMRKSACLLLPLALAACNGDQAPAIADAGGNAPDAYVATDWVLPSSPGCAQPNLVAIDDRL